MEFSVIAIGNNAPSKGVSQTFLVGDRWDDWGKYRTQFYIVIFDEKGQRHEPGSVKIGQFGLQPNDTIEIGKRAPEIPNSFKSLNQDLFSLGQGQGYYEALNELTPHLRDEFLTALRDVAHDLNLFEKAIEEDVMQESLLRSFDEEMVRNRFHRLSIGDATLTAFQFCYKFPPPSQPIAGYEPPSLDFFVKPNSLPPTNIHVLIGRNGVGKSHCMQHLAKTVLGLDGAGTISPALLMDSNFSEKKLKFSEMISVSFSAFDEFDLPNPATTEIKASSIGLRTFRHINDRSVDGTSPSTSLVAALKEPQELNTDFTESFNKCRTEPKRRRWLRAIKTLCNDPLFAETHPEELASLDDDNWEQDAIRFFRKLSSGHKIVLLTITRLVELVHERTLILLDEPEGHLHPPLLSAFIRSLSDLLIQRNGVAIIATHSPVVLQEIPKSCVWILNRAGHQSSVCRPQLETFGENVGVLTRAVFGLEVTTSGFHELLNKVINIENLSYEQLIEKFRNQLGAEGKGIAQVLVNQRGKKAET